MSKTVLCDNLKAGLDRFRPFPPETLASLRNYYRVGLTWSSNALDFKSSLTFGFIYGKPIKKIIHADLLDFFDITHLIIEFTTDFHFAG